MKKLIKKSLIALSYITMLGSCSDDFLDLVPKGMNTLATIDDIELLLNNTESGGLWTDNLLVMDNDILNYPYSNEYYINAGPTALEYGWNSWDESFKREGLMNATPYYSSFYSAIARMNTVIASCNKTSGDATKKAQLIAEAKVRRAYFYFLLANVFCKGYTNAEEAKNTQGIPFPLEFNVTDENPQVSLATVYEGIKADLSDDVIAALPAEGKNQMRAGKSFAYAVRSLVDLYTHQYEKAVTDADACLTINNNIKDYAEFNGTVPQWHYYEKENIFVMYYLYTLMTHIYTSQVMQDFEPGNYLKDYAKNSDGGPFFDEDYVETLLTDKGAHHEGAAAARFGLANNKDPQFNDSGLRVPQIVMVKAEAQALSGKYKDAMKTLNDLRKLRVHPDYYKDLTANTEAEAMSHIMPYVITENLFTGWTFFTRKRWNTMPAYKKNYTRKLGDKTYTLTPESQYWVVPFAQDVTDYNSTVKQNY